MNKHAEFFTRLFQEFNDKRITYCVLKNYDSLPDTSTRDVDIWVDKKEQKRALKILFTVADSLEWKLIKTSIRMGYYKGGDYYFFNKNSNPNVIVIDISPFLHWKGISYLDEDIFKENIIIHEKGFNVPRPGIEAGALIFRGAMMGEIKEKDKSKIIECIEKDSKTFLKVLKKPFGKKIAINLLNKIREEKWGDIENDINHLHFIIFKRAIIHRPLHQIKQWIFYYYERIKDHLFPKGSFFIAFIGPDGSGKTTTANALIEKESIKRLFCMRKYIYRRLYITWFKRLTSIIKKRNLLNVDASKNDYGEIIPLSPSKAILYIIYLAIEFFLGQYYIRRLRSNSALIVFDRYFYDYLVFKDFENCPRWLSLMLIKIVPKPDAVIYLKNEAEVIYNRKCEYPLNEIKRQIEVYKSIKKLIPNLIEIETKESIEAVLCNIEKLILTRFLKND